MIESKKSVSLLRLLNKRTFTLLLIIIQSCGIRFFGGQGVALAVLILLFSYQGLSKLRKTDFYVLATIAFYFVLNKISNPSFVFSKLIFQYTLVIEAYIFLLTYKTVEQFLIDFYAVLKLIFIHALVGYILYFSARSIFKPVVFSGAEYKTFFYLFYVANFEGFARNTGMLWEPGLLQLMLNLFLFLCIRYNRKWYLLLLITATILTTYSTSGYIILGLNYAFYILYNFKNKARVITVIFLTLIATVPIAIVKGNIADKFSGENTSGLARYRDFLIGVDLIKEKPFLGHGNFDKKYLVSKSYVTRIEQELFTSTYLETTGDMAGGYTNGLLGLFCWYGIPFGIIAYVLFYKNRMVKEKTYGRIIFFLILGVTLISEPITYTAFFLLFPFSFFVFNKKYYPSLNAV